MIKRSNSRISWWIYCIFGPFLLKLQMIFTILVAILAAILDFWWWKFTMRIVVCPVWPEGHITIIILQFGILYRYYIEILCILTNFGGHFGGHLGFKGQDDLLHEFMSYQWICHVNVSPKWCSTCQNILFNSWDIAYYQFKMAAGGHFGFLAHNWT